MEQVSRIILKIHYKNAILLKLRYSSPFIIHPGQCRVKSCELNKDSPREWSSALSFCRVIQQNQFIFYIVVLNVKLKQTMFPCKVDSTYNLLILEICHLSSTPTSNLKYLGAIWSHHLTIQIK
ncbi:Hypothetical_protein [Hexamita inflata]|uniref:Hypothetical_protein n=1 Tax=Hexamita inflata TaxID=28002 RepID=A0AA86PVZ7_9EUKA|nr:Hypothetical protein HINF_LOCUS32313 [Hexamita inflata]CAI9944673.1 Hypothetical protein HINF_LOCUS32318 [Hexamita inflata]